MYQAHTFMAAAVLAGIFFATATPAAAARDIKEVKLFEMSDRKELVSAYPFLKDAVAEVDKTDAMMKTSIAEEGGDKAAAPVTRILASKISFSDLKKNILIVRYSSMVDCGTEGCMTAAYIDDGKGYYNAFGAIVHEGLHVSACDGVLSLLVPVKDGIAEWKLKDKEFTIDKTYPDLAALPACK